MGLEPNVELKLMRILGEFTGMVLRNARIRTRYVQGRDVLILELLFSVKSNPSETKTAILALDESLTIDEHAEAVKLLLKEQEEA